MILIIPVAIPGSGKTSWADAFGFPRVSSDDIRDELELGGANNYDAARNAEVFETFYERIEFYSGLRSGRSVYADATNLTDQARTSLRQIAERIGCKTHVIFFTNIDQAVERNQKRDRVVPPEAMVTMLIKYEQALRDVPLEGYDSITYINKLD